MAVIKSKVLGFCEGGRASIEGVLELAKDGSKVYVYGKLLHNKNAIKDLEEKGIIFLEPKPGVKVEGKLAIRAHGVTDCIKAQLCEKNQVVDLTCPKVLKINWITKMYEKKGFHIVYLGKAKHPEVDGTLGNLKNYTLIHSLEGAQKIQQDKVAFVAQSTANLETFREIADYFAEHKPQAIVVDTICWSTRKRQEEAESLAKKVDIMVIIGGKDSANTAELVATCKKFVPSIWVEKPEEIKKNLAELKKIKNIGLTAGASTPDEDIDKLYEILKAVDSGSA